ERRTPSVAHRHLLAHETTGGREHLEPNLRYLTSPSKAESQGECHFRFESTETRAFALPHLEHVFRATPPGIISARHSHLQFEALTTSGFASRPSRASRPRFARQR